MDSIELLIDDFVGDTGKNDLAKLSNVRFPKMNGSQNAEG